MRMRLINLDRTPDRLALFRERNPLHANIPRYAAVDGNLTDRQMLIDNNILSPDLAYTDVALGCALSHIAQWSEAARDGVAVTVIEDDAIICANFKEQYDRLTAKLPGDWDYVMWGYNFDAPVAYDILPGLSPCTTFFNQNTLRRAATQFASFQIQTTPFRLIQAFGAVAYTVSPRGAQRLLQYCIPIRPMALDNPNIERPLDNLGIDCMMSNVLSAMTAYIAIPPLVITENDDATSTVQDPPPKPRSAAITNEPEPPKQSVRSFAFFDTLVARRCAHPHDIFRQIEGLSGRAGFANARVAAEARISARPYTLDDIYEEMDLTVEDSDLLKALELATEESVCVPIQEVCSQVKPGDLIVSDTYLPDVFVRNIVGGKCGLPFSPVFLSSNDKRNGTAWPQLGGIFDIKEHFGADQTTDIVSPGQYGIPASLTTISEPTECEALLGQRGLAPLASLIREARLVTWNEDPVKRRGQLAQLQANFPLLFLASLHLIRTARTQGWTNLLFSGRNCYLWLRLFRVLTKVLSVDIQSEYFYTSRLAKVHPSPAYLGYFNSLCLTKTTAIVDICGTGWSSQRLIEQSASPNTAIFLIEHTNNASVVQEYLKLGQTSSAGNVHSIAPQSGDSGVMEMLNCAKHPRIEDVAEISGEFFPLFSGLDYDSQRMSLIDIHHSAFLRATSLAVRLGRGECEDMLGGTHADGIADAYARMASFRADLDPLFEHRAREENAFWTTMNRRRPPQPLA